MTPEQWQKIKLILEQAVEIPPASRSIFLDENCPNDSLLRKEIEYLLEFENTQANLLEQNAYSAMLGEDSIAEEDLVGRQIGSYKIVRELGTGGMGKVFLAERADGIFDQKAALKLIKRGMDSNAILQRFINERQILATLEHPNIAHLVDGGTTREGLPFFVMEYVEGLPITEFVEKHELDLEEKLKLFREVCAAVSFAHQNLIIHRDLKPSNILITKDGKVKLLDFGIAKLLKTDSNEAVTATQNFIFTPEYASPEQIRGEKLTTATDVYSLGVILFELLTGSRPFKTQSKNISEILKAVCETEPERPSSVVSQRSAEYEETTPNKQRTTNNGQQTNPKSKIQNPKSLKGDLDNIILKALRKEPERRYASVEQFSEDVRRHLAGLPVFARKDTWNYRASKFIQRNKIGVAAAGLTILSLIGGLTATVYQANKAERRFQDVRQLANSFLFEFHDAIKNLPGSTPARELVVKRAVEYLDKLAAESEGDLTLLRELGTAYARIGEIQGNSYHSNLGDTDGAMKSYRRSLEIRQKVAAADPNNLEFQYELADSHEGVGDMFYTMGELKTALQSYETSLAIREKIDFAAPGNLQYRYSLANILGKRGDVSGMEGYPNLGDLPRAIESYRRSVSLYEELVKVQPENNKYQVGYALVLVYYGMLQNVSGDAEGSIASGRKSVSILERLIAADPNNANYEMNLMSALTFMRYPLLAEGLTDEAVKNARRNVATMEKQVNQDPKNNHARRSLSVSYNSLGICLLAAGDTKGAIENHQKSLAIAEELLAADASSEEKKRDSALTLEFLANAQLKAGDYDSALGSYRRSLSAYNKDSDSAENKADTPATLYAGIAKTQAAKDDLRNAAENIRRAVPLAESAAQNAPSDAKLQNRLADAYLDAGRILKRFAQISKNEKDKREACGYLQKSLNSWNALRQKGILSKINESRPNEAAKELVSCGV